LAEVHTPLPVDSATGAVDLDRLIAELERGDLERRLALVRSGQRDRIPFLDFVGGRWIRRLGVAVV